MKIYYNKIMKSRICKIFWIQMSWFNKKINKLFIKKIINIQRTAFKMIYKKIVNRFYKIKKCIYLMKKNNKNKLS